MAHYPGNSVNLRDVGPESLARVALTRDSQIIEVEVLDRLTDWRARLGGQRLVSYSSADCTLVRCGIGSPREWWQLPDDQRAAWADSLPQVWLVDWGWGSLGEDGDADFGVSLWPDAEAARHEFERRARELSL